MRQCPKCREVKQWEDFPLSKATRTGYDYKCKECHRAAWHARKPPKLREIFCYHDGWELNQKTIREIFTFDGEVFRWAVNTVKTRVGDFAGESSGRQIARIFVNNKRYRLDDLVSLWNDGEIKPRLPRQPRNVVYEAEWMREIRSHATGFDWSCLWKKDRPRNTNLENKKIDTKKYNRGRDHRRVINDGDDSRPRGSKRLIRSHNALTESCREIFSHILSKVKHSKSDRHWRLIGCTEGQLRRHLESKMKRGMAWENHGKVWHIDHKLPVSMFNHRCDKERLICWHWTNLEPLEAKANLIKSDTIQTTQFQLLIER